MAALLPLPLSDTCVQADLLPMEDTNVENAASPLTDSQGKGLAIQDGGRPPGAVTAGAHHYVPTIVGDD
jgi:hypothetical protein